MIKSKANALKLLKFFHNCQHDNLTEIEAQEQFTTITGITLQQMENAGNSHMEEIEKYMCDYLGLTDEQLYTIVINEKFNPHRYMSPLGKILNG